MKKGLEKSSKPFFGAKKIRFGKNLKIRKKQAKMQNKKIL